MKMGTRLATVVAVAVVGALGQAGNSLGAGSSTATLDFTPDTVPKDSYRKGSLFVHTHTNYTGPVGMTKTARAQLDFDDDLKINTQGIPKCAKASVSGNITMQQAMAACGNARVGNGRAEANLTTPGDIEGCVLAFNGRPSGGRPTLLLFTRLNIPGNINCSNPAQNTNGNGSILLEGLLKAASGDFGTQLDVDNIPQTAPLSDFRVTVERGSYVSARCHDPNRQWNLRTRFTYLSPSSTQTVNDSEPCQVSATPPPPNTEITKAKIKSKRRKAKFEFEAQGTATGFECQLKRKGHGTKPFRGCDSPKKYKRLKRGKYTFEVRAVGPGGKDPSPDEKRFKIRRR
jgi:hypothetical protein